MKISSMSCMDHYAETEHSVDVPLLSMRSAIRSFFRKLDRMLTAMAYAEAGDLDSVKEILEQNQALVKQ